MKETVGVRRRIIIKTNKHFIKKDSPYGFEYIYLFTALRQVVGHGSEVRSSIWHSCSWNNSIEMWEIEWPEEKTGSFNLMTFYRDAIDLEIDVFHSIPCYYITQVRRHKISDEHTFFVTMFCKSTQGGSIRKGS